MSSIFINTYSLFCFYCLRSKEKFGIQHKPPETETEKYKCLETAWGLSHRHTKTATQKYELSFTKKWMGNKSNESWAVYLLFHESNQITDYLIVRWINPTK